MQKLRNRECGEIENSVGYTRWGEETEKYSKDH